MVQQNHDGRAGFASQRPLEQELTRLEAQLQLLDRYAEEIPERETIAELTPLSAWQADSLRGIATVRVNLDGLTRSFGAVRTARRWSALSRMLGMLQVLPLSG